MSPIACPKCNYQLIRLRGIGGRVPDLWCPVCRRHWTDNYLAAFSRCTDLQAVMYSTNYIAIKPRRGTDDAWLIKILFDKKDRHYSFLHGWMIRGLFKYGHLKCVKVAIEAFHQQYPLLEAI